MTDKYLQSFLCFSLLANRKNIRMFFSDEEFVSVPLSSGNQCKTEYALRFTHPFYWVMNAFHLNGYCLVLYGVPSKAHKTPWIKRSIVNFVLFQKLIFFTRSLIRAIMSATVLMIKFKANYISNRTIYTFSRWFSSGLHSISTDASAKHPRTFHEFQRRRNSSSAPTQQYLGSV